MPKPILDYRDDDSPLWPARCRGYLEGRQASDCLASVELARLRAECERLRAIAEEKCQRIVLLEPALDGLLIDYSIAYAGLVRRDGKDGGFCAFEERDAVRAARAALKAEP